MQPSLQPLPSHPPAAMSIIERLALAVYGACMGVLAPLLHIKLRRRAQREPGYAQQVPERFGVYDTIPPAAGCLWVHAVSLGETRAAALLISELRALLPGVPLLLTHGTATGREQGVALLQPGDHQVWLPWDAPGAVQRFVAHFRPRVGVLMETEVWPCLVQACARAQVPLVLANARLNETSLRKAQRLAWLSGPAYRGLARVLAQGQADAQRLQALGAPVAGVFGNLKFDVAQDAALAQRGRRWRAAAAGRRIVILASTREGEEAMWLQAVQSLQAPGSEAEHATLRQVLWLVVPRHPQRFDEVHRLLCDAGLAVQRRSAWHDDPPATSDTTPAQAWLGDSVGEMQAYYAAADVALLGGSFAPLGGQNLIEALACGCPVVMGPHTFNFADAARSAQGAGAAWHEHDMLQAVRRVLRMQAPELAQASAQGLALVTAGRGAAQRQAQAVAELLSAPPAR